MLTGYVGDGSLLLVTKEDAEKLTHINIAFGHVINDEVRVDHLNNLNYMKTIREYNPDIKLILSVGGWGAGGFSEAASTLKGRRTLADTAVEVLKTYGFDGIDLDWEYPGYSEAGIKSSPDDKFTFTLLLKEVREALDRQGEKDRVHYLLTIAAGADQYFVDSTEMDKAQELLDFVQLMTYDMRGGFQTLTGHHTNLFTPSGDLFRISVDTSVKIFMRAGVPREKILIGAAFYSRMWKNVPNINNGLHQMTTTSGGYGPGYAQLLSDYINKNGYLRYWDNEAKAPYLFDGSNFITYDDEESLKYKSNYVKQMRLAGIMYWEHGCDATRTLLDAIHKEMSK
jgi:chitinase